MAIEQVSDPQVRAILHMPHWAPNHEYIIQLTDHLNQNKVSVRLSTGTRTAISSIIRLLCYERHHIDILHLHWTYQFMGRAGFLKQMIRLFVLVGLLSLFRLFRCRIVWTVHDYPLPDSRYPFLDRLYLRLMSTISHAVIVHCQTAKEIVGTITASPSKLHVIEHPNFDKMTKNFVTRSEARKYLELDSETMVFLFFGSIRPHKGVRDLVAAFQKLNSTEAVLLLVGENFRGPDVEEIRVQVKQAANIKLVLGYIPDSLVQIYMNAADVVVFPYREILTSGALLLAMTFAKPCIVSRRGCLAEIIGTEGGICYEPDVEGELLRALKECLSDKPRLLAMGARNRQMADQWSWDWAAFETAKLYRSLL